MIKPSLYNDVVQMYLRLQANRRNALDARRKLDAQIDFLEEQLTDLNDILCKHGEHIYEHFMEKESEAVNEENTK